MPNIAKPVAEKPATTLSPNLPRLMWSTVATILAAITGGYRATWKVANTWMRSVAIAIPAAHVNESKTRSNSGFSLGELPHFASGITASMPARSAAWQMRTDSSQVTLMRRSVSSDIVDARALLTMNSASLKRFSSSRMGVCVGSTRSSSSVDIAGSLVSGCR